MAYRPSFLDVLDLEVEVDVKLKYEAGSRSLSFEPNGELRIEEGVEDAYDALESRYGWERFLKEVRPQVLAEIAERLEVRVVKMDSVRTSDSRQEDEDLVEFLMEHHPDFFE